MEQQQKEDKFERALRNLDGAIDRFDRNTEDFKTQFEAINAELDKVLKSTGSIIETIIVVGVIEALAICALIAGFAYR